MCGLVGIVGEGAGTAAVAAMSATIAHRGPDADGLMFWDDHDVALAHRRLTILDLSDAGKNPMTYEHEDAWIVYNGEVYNFQLLREELEELGHRFRTKTDTEVVLHAYLEWGDAHTSRLRGMFAYAIYDRRRPERGPRLLLVRDRLGVKPLYYYRDQHRFAFASELKAFKALPGAQLPVDAGAISDYWTYMYIPTPKSVYSTVRKLPAGHTLVWDEGAVRIQEYWDVPVHDHGEPLTDGAVRTALESSVSAHLLSDVPVGLFLSGGVDSSCIAALSDAGGSRLEAFSVGFDVAEHSELPFARAVAERFAADYHERVVTAIEAEASVESMVDMFDEPFADGSALPTNELSRLAREHVKVTLSGDAGDEVFAGYGWYWAWLSRQSVHFLPSAVRRSLSLASNVPGVPHKGWLDDIRYDGLDLYAHLLELFSPTDKPALIGSGLDPIHPDDDHYWHWRRYWNEELSPLRRMQYVDLKTYLPDDIFTKVDRTSMAASLEVRPPLADHLLVELMFTSKAPTMRTADDGKRQLKNAMANILPDEVLHRRKRGFSAPWNAWLRDLSVWARPYVNEGVAIREGILSPDWHRTITGDRAGARLWAVALLEAWCRRTLGP